MKNGYIFCDGPGFSIEWYYNANGNSQANEYFDELEIDAQQAAHTLFFLMARAGSIKNIRKFRHEGDKIYAFKPMPHRFLCFFAVGRKLIVTNAFEKKQDKLPPREKEKALLARKDYLKRVEDGNYYD